MPPLPPPDRQAFRANVAWHDEVGSTMDEARLLALGHAPAGATVVARSQRQGRGQNHAVWQSPVGGLYLTTVLWPDPRWPVPSLSPALALGLAGIGAALGGSALAVKWPNDILGARGKVAGLLLERGQTERGEAFVLVGLGLNLAVPTLETDPAATKPPLPASGLLAEGVPAAALAAWPQLTEAVLKRIEAAYLGWQAAGFGPRCADYDRAHAWRGRQAWATHGAPARQPLTGEVGNVAADGALALHTATGTHWLQSATLRLPPG